MKRLTELDEYGNADIIGVNSPDLQLHLEFDEFNRVTDALNKLAAYKNMGIPPVDMGVLTLALYTYGEVPQVDMMIEEMSELTKALLKHRRVQNEGCQFDYERECVNAVVEEMADVYIVLLQMIYLFDKPDLFDEYVRNKILRLRTRLSADEETEAGE